MKTIFDKTNLGNLQLKNRLIRSATWEALADERGHFSEEIYGIYEQLAAGGVGCIISGFTSVADDDYYFGGMARLSNDGLIPEHKRLTDTVHAHGCPIIVQLAMGEYNTAETENIGINKLTEADIADIENKFAEAADRAVRAGYDGVQIHAAHGFFLSRFISPAYDHRSDRYGDNPALIFTEIIDEIKKQQPELHITMKINCNDFIMGGIEKDDFLAYCKQCIDHGINSIEVSGNGTSVSGIKSHINEAYFAEAGAELARVSPVPVILVGGHRSIENMNEVLNNTKIELLSLSRPLIREPDLPKRWESGDTSPSKCVSCNGCYRSYGHKCVFKRG